ncbi:hypothetical protein Nepgr_003581 [Nepenthes gracilis]|uniref:Photosynthetic NDH subunit of lumenal location 2, chloroplastic n=1 Tax=Nepenthes gracilis TaxID=150966 RepID=A0AAD3RZW7_NEPGR|nr:hypothetical protein Nepgr_003581 [Nepenthes gracilis]
MSACITNLTTSIISTTHNHRSQRFRPILATQASYSCKENRSSRRKIVSVLLATSLIAVGLNGAPAALAEKWGTRSFLWEHFFEPDLSPEDAADRIRQTADGLHSLRHMLETMSWRYVIFYIRLKSAYLKKDMKAALSTVPAGRRRSYIDTANELIDNMAEFDFYVRTPKVYESYVFYEKTLKSIDNLVALLA